MKQTMIKKLASLHPCNEAVEWLKEQSSMKVAWETCERGDWMLWLLGKLSGKIGSKSRKKLVWTACQCARLSLKYVTEGEKQPLITIKTTEKYSKGLATLKEVKSAYAAATDVDAKNKILKQCADIVRENYPKAPKLNKTK